MGEWGSGHSNKYIKRSNIALNIAIFRAKNTLLREEHGQMARAKRHFLPGYIWHKPGIMVSKLE